MKYCKDYAALLDLYVDGELSAEDMIRVQEHLDRCPGCRAYVDAAFAMRAAFPDAEDTAVPDGFTESVMAAVRLSPRQGKRKTPWVKILTPLAACCAIVILLQSGPMFNGAKKDAAAESVLFDAAEEAMDMADYAVAQNDAKSYSHAAVEDNASAKDETSTAPAGGAAPSEEYKEEPAAAPVRYATTIHLPAECLDLLKDEVPVSETADEIHYELEPAACDTLQAQLKDREILCSVGHSTSPTTDLILVIVRK